MSPQKKPTTTKTSEPESIQVSLIETEELAIPLTGMTGLYCHRMSQKASKDLLLGNKKKTAAERLLIKHHPLEEFRKSMYYDEGRQPDAAIFFPVVAFKRAMRTIATELPGLKGTQVDRLIFVPDELVPIIGVPLLRMDITRSSDIGRTPDVRTRAYFPEWSAVLRVRYAKPALNKRTVLNLITNAGMFIGVGDNRQERGKGSYGTFRPSELSSIKTKGNKAAQVSAYTSPVADKEHGDTAALLDDYFAEVKKRA